LSFSPTTKDTKDTKVEPFKVVFVPFVYLVVSIKF